MFYLIFPNEFEEQFASSLFKLKQKKLQMTIGL